MANSPPAEVVIPYLTSAATIVYVQKWLKTLEFYQRFVKAFPGADKYAHWVVAGAMSVIAATGIHWVWTGTLLNGGVLTINVPQLSDILHGVSSWFKVYITQHTIYEATTAGPTPAPPTGGV